MKEMKFTIGGSKPVEILVTNWQGFVEYEILRGYASEREVRSCVGNTGRGMYQNHYDGNYFNRKPAIEIMSENLKQLKQEVEDLEFAIKVTKRKNWIKSSD